MEHFDVVIVGAGLSGIGAAVHLRQQLPAKSFVLLEARDAIGGTWDLFRYPGVRSDSDMHTLGYRFKPWLDAKAIADGPAILEYLKEAAREHGIDRHIRHRHRVKKAAWSSESAVWTIEAERAGSDETVAITCNFILMCAGYYSYRQGHTPEFAGRDRFKGPIVHPQEWDESLDFAGKRVVVIGSGATAMTLVPALAKTASHVVLLQRSPTYVVSRPDRDAIANFLRKVLPERWAYSITRWKNVGFQQRVYQRTRTDPEFVKKRLLDMVRKELGPDFDIETHFTPRYNPWDQRLCLIPNSDLFEALRTGRASVVTSHIDTFTEKGVRLQSGEELEADIIVTATGLTLAILGEAQFSVDGEAVDFAKKWTYKGLMYSDVPNVVATFGYINASWTLRADLTSEYACRLLNHMDSLGAKVVTPRLRAGDANMAARPWIDGFSSGYMQRAMHRFPRQGDREPWINPQNYGRDREMIRSGAIEDGALQFTGQLAAMPALRITSAQRA
ncbi:MAG TPA: NAD(P)/FAD-dependent oxidoreductase [Burkholderiales bacterium]|jgi:cation diffusion facilitator CzcD-associated flavoprotein CzcO|nr:NAD(P)/FAD-dependent oxidoreductase [Burkholderiales bacterium]